MLSRRTLLQGLMAGSVVAMAGSSAPIFGQEEKGTPVGLPDLKGAGARFGLVTYQWGKDWDLATLLTNLQTAGVNGVELRTTHKHGVEPTLTAVQREDVKKRFENSPVVCVGLGSDERFDNPDPAIVQKAIEATKKFIVLSHDIGGTGVKVKPDSFHAGVPKEKTIEQIGKALNEVAEFANGYGQQIRLEVHGQCAELPTIAAILKVADQSNVVVCWNCNPTDLQGEGLAKNFALVKDRLGDTVHIHKLDTPGYPYPQLFDLFVQEDYAGWMLLEEGKLVEEPVLELAMQKAMFTKMWQLSQKKVG